MRKWLVLASHDENGTREDTLQMDNPDGFERVAVVLSSNDDERPTPDEITEALADYGDGEYLFVPLDGDAFSGGIKVIRTVDVQWTGGVYA